MQPGDIFPFHAGTAPIVLAFGVSVLGAYMALRAFARSLNLEDGSQWGYLAVSAMTLGAVGIWSAYFLGMAIYPMPMEVGYGLAGAASALAIAFAFSAAALWCLRKSRPGMGWHMLAGVLAGVAVSGGYFLGMGAMRMQAYVEWDTEGMAYMLLAAVVLATAALSLARREGWRWRGGAAVLLGIAVCGQLYAGQTMGVAVFTTPRPEDGFQLDPGVLAYLAMLLVGVTLVVALAESRRDAAAVDGL
ncbi:MHYT domain-containing protein [Pigmentiphaga soli]|uniref:MHYT domain-containing protein n=1 Tax=Pigmentiphaga soli TaxID=1007095 RepID=A0ABP8H605_9BURK